MLRCLLALSVLLCSVHSRTSSSSAPEGTFVSFENGKAEGWAIIPSSSLPVLLDIYVNQTFHSHVLANEEPSGHNFSVSFPNSESNFRVDVFALAPESQTTKNRSYPLNDSPRTYDPTFRGLPIPQGVQGLDDENIVEELWRKKARVELTQRTAQKAELLQPGIQRYNVWWAAVENQVASSSSPLSCPEGTWLIPQNEQQRKELGFNKYHCYNTHFFKIFDDMFALDKTVGSITAAIIYCTPALYRYSGCTGFHFGKKIFKCGCVPRADAMPDWEDYITLLAWRYSQRSAANPITHWVMWNEVAYAGWLDYSPIIPNRAGPKGSNPLTPHQFDMLVSKYADMLFTAQRAIRRHTRAALMWVSTDRLWTRPKQKEGEPLHVGEVNFLDRLWPKVGIELDWGLVVHPYGPPNVSQWTPTTKKYTFLTLNEVIAYQRHKLLTVANVTAGGQAIRPQQWLYAAEQGWPHKGNPEALRAFYICSAHNISTSELHPNMIGVTHNFFQDSPGSNSQGGDNFGLVQPPPIVYFNLTNGVKVSLTYDAYVSTSPTKWRKSNNHFCCKQHRLGCMDE